MAWDRDSADRLGIFWTRLWYHRDWHGMGIVIDWHVHCHLTAKRPWIPLSRHIIQKGGRAAKGARRLHLSSRPGVPP
jgi:hypothetical protein